MGGCKKRKINTGLIAQLVPWDLFAWPHFIRLPRPQAIFFVTKVEKKTETLRVRIADQLLAMITALSHLEYHRMI